MTTGEPSRTRRSYRAPVLCVALLAFAGCGGALAPSETFTGVWEYRFYARSATKCPRMPAGFAQNCGGSGHLRFSDDTGSLIKSFGSGGWGCSVCGHAVDGRTYGRLNLRVSENRMLLYIGSCRLTAAVPGPDTEVLEGAAVCPVPESEDAQGTWRMTRVR
jgi:hypothetical protein